MSILFLTEARGRQAREALLKANARIEEESVARVAAQEQVKMLKEQLLSVGASAAHAPHHHHRAVSPASLYENVMRCFFSLSRFLPLWHLTVCVARQARPTRRSFRTSCRLPQKRQRRHSPCHADASAWHESHAEVPAPPLVLGR